MIGLGRTFTAVLVVLGLGAVPPAVAQQTHVPGRATRVPVSVALVDALPTGAPFQILRSIGPEPGDVILLPARANADDLSDAVQALLTLRRLQGDTAGTAGAMRVRRPQGHPHAQPRRYPWVARVLNDLRTAPVKRVPGVGTVPALEIWLPPQRRR